IGLENDPDLPVAIFSGSCKRQTRDIRPRDKNLARVGAVERRNEIEEGSFAGARRAGHLDQFTYTSLERHTIESFDGCCPSAVALRNASHGDEWRHDYLPFSERAVAMGWRSNRRQVGVMPRATAANAMAAIAAATDKSNLGSIAPRLAISDGKANSVG